MTDGNEGKLPGKICDPICIDWIMICYYFKSIINKEVFIELIRLDIYFFNNKSTDKYRTSKIVSIKFLLD